MIGVVELVTAGTLLATPAPRSELSGPDRTAIEPPALMIDQLPAERIRSLGPNTVLAETSIARGRLVIRR